MSTHKKQNSWWVTTETRQLIARLGISSAWRVRSKYFCLQNSVVQQAGRIPKLTPGCKFLRIHESWPTFQMVCIVQENSSVSSLATPLTRFIYTCSRLPPYFPRCGECILSELEQLVTKLQCDLALLHGFKRRPWDCIPRKNLAQPMFIDFEEEAPEGIGPAPLRTSRGPISLNVSLLKGL